MLTSRYESSMSEAEGENFVHFLHELQNCVLVLMSQFDSLVTVDDVIEGGKDFCNSVFNG